MVRGASRRSGGSFGSGPASSRKSRNEMLRERYSTDRYPTPEDFIRAVEENPDLFDPGLGDNSNFRYDDSGNGRGVSGNNLGGRNKSQWIGDNPVNVDVSTDPGSISVSSEIYSDDSGNAVSLVAGVDLIPMGINVNVSGDVGTIAVDLGMPGDAIGVTVGASFDVNTGEVIGGELGLAGGGLSVSVSQIKKDGEICNTITVTYFGIGTAYQRCRKDDESDEKDPKKEPPPPANDDEIPPPPPIDQIPGDPDNQVFAIRTYHTFIKYENFDEKGKYYESTRTGHGLASMLTGQGLILIGSVGSYTASHKYEPDRNANTTSAESAYIGFYGEPFPGAGITPEWFWEGFNPVYGWYSITPGGTPSGGSSFLGSVKDCNQWLKWQNDPEQINTQYSRQRGWQRCSLAFYHILETGKEGPEKPKEPEPPIPPEDPVTCCDLEPVMSLLRKVSTAIGVDDLPANMPKSLLENKGNISIPSLAQFLAYQEDTLDQRLGKFPIEMEIIDTDPLTPGNQAKKVKLQNLAETLAELFGLAVSGANDSAIQTSAAFRTLVELVTTRQTVIQNYRSIEAIMEWLGFAVSEEKEMMKSLITIPKGEEEVFEEITRYLQESEIEIKVNQLADKNNLRVELKELLHAAAIIKTLFFKKVDPNGSMKEQLKPWLDSFNPNNADTEKDWKDRIEFLLEQLAKDESGNIDKDKVAKIMNTYQLQKDE